MTRQEVKEKLQNNIEVKKEIKNTLLGLVEKAESLKHYKVINNGYINKLTEALPLTESYTMENGEVKTYSPYYLKIGYKNFNGIFEDIELTLRKSYKGKTFTSEQKLTEDYESFQYEETIYIGNRNGQIKAEEMPERIKERAETIAQDIERIEKELTNIDEIIDNRNKAIDELTEIIAKNDALSYTTRATMPELKLPYISKFDYIQE
jgi:hypothetical protein